MVKNCFLKKRVLVKGVLLDWMGDGKFVSGILAA